MFIDKFLSLAFGLIFLLMLACSDAPETENQQAVENPPAVKIISANAAFLDYAASTNMLQIELARLAVERGQREDVKIVGEHALKYHTHALAQLKTVIDEAQRANLPDSLGAADQSIVTEFRELPVAEFDGRYRDYIISSHSSQLERYQEMLAEVEKEKLKTWITDVQGHLQERMRLATSDTLAL